MKKKLKFITELTKDLGDIRLSSACGKYSDLVYNGEEVLVTSFVGKYGYKQTPVEKLDKKTIDVIYEDLQVDFGD